MASCEAPSDFESYLTQQPWLPTMWRRCLCSCRACGYVWLGWPGDGSAHGTGWGAAALPSPGPRHYLWVGLGTLSDASPSRVLFSFWNSVKQMLWKLPRERMTITKFQFCFWSGVWKPIASSWIFFFFFLLSRSRVSLPLEYLFPFVRHSNVLKTALFPGNRLTYF